MAENRFNLVDEPWLPVVSHGKVSLREIFNNESLTQIGGNPLEHVATLKLLFAIAQSAWTPDTEEDWEDSGKEMLRERINTYLNEHYDCFWLYGDKPFLQVPDIADNDFEEPLGFVYLNIATGNNSIVRSKQKKASYSDAEKAMVVLLSMGMCPSIANSVKTNRKIAQGYVKEKAAAPGINLRGYGVLHSYIQIDSILETVYCNLFTKEILGEIGIADVGISPIEKMPAYADDAIAQSLKTSYMGRLLPVNRFVLLGDIGLYIINGVSFEDSLLKLPDPTMISLEDGKLLWASVSKKPWRELDSILSFLEGKEKHGSCVQLETVVRRLQEEKECTIWTGGVEVSSMQGGQCIKGTDDYVESLFDINSSQFGSRAYQKLKNQLNDLDDKAKILRRSVCLYWKAEGIPNSDKKANSVLEAYWRQAEEPFYRAQESADGYASERLVKWSQKTIRKLYEGFCPHATAKELESWIINCPFKSSERENAMREEVVKAVNIALKRSQNDTSFRSGLKKADIIGLMHQSWEPLAACGVNLNNERECSIYGTVLAALVRTGRTSDGNLSFGRGLRAAYASNPDPAKARMHKILSCNDVKDACRAIKPMLGIIASRGVALNYKMLLDDLLSFSETTKRRWAQQFYCAPSKEEDEQ